MKRVCLTAFFLAVLLVPLCLIIASAGNGTEAFKICGALGDNMVLQRDTEICVWGTSCKTGETVKVYFKGTEASCTVSEDGTWEVYLPPQKADCNESELTAVCGDESVTLKGILVGDVFLIGGQSNAEKTLGTCSNRFYRNSEKKAMIASANECIRFFKQGYYDAVTNSEKMNTPQTEPLPGKMWQKETITTANEFSAMGFFFAHEIYDKTGIPTGLVMVASGGSPVCQLMSPDAVKASGYNLYQNGIPVSGMYNALMSPFIKMKIKGMLYYQGENEQYLAHTDYGKYNEYVNYYVEDLRSKMNQDFPFYYVQLSSHGGEGLNSWMYIGEQRAVQFDGLNVIRKSGMVVSMDMGYYKDGIQNDWAHPDRKKPVGQRLAWLMLARDYGIGDEEYVSSPFPEYAYRTEDGIVIHFKNVAEGLVKSGDYGILTGFKAIDRSGNYTDISSSIISRSDVFLEVSGLPDVSGIGYGIEELAFPEFDEVKYIANLGNSSGLPAPSFKLMNILDQKPAEPEENKENDAGINNKTEIHLSDKDGQISDTTVIIVCIAMLFAVAAAVTVVINNHSVSD